MHTSNMIYQAARAHQTDLRRTAARPAPKTGRQSAATDALRLRALVAWRAARPSAGAQPTPATVHRCGVEMDAIDSSVTVPLTGDSWVLYRARRLQSFGAADSGPAPGAEKSRLSGRAGVAQG